MRETETSAPSLGKLSEAVPQCEWKASGRYIGTANHMSLIGECRDENGNWSDTKTSKAKAAFVARLASDYFAGRLIDPTAMAEAVASARAEGVKEGLERAATTHSKDFQLMLVRIIQRHRNGRDLTETLDGAADLLKRKGSLSVFRGPAPPTLIPGGSSDV